jgi:hypothetical protein
MLNRRWRRTPTRSMRTRLPSRFWMPIRSGVGARSWCPARQVSDVLTDRGAEARAEIGQAIQVRSRLLVRRLGGAGITPDTRRYSGDRMTGSVKDLMTEARLKSQQDAFEATPPCVETYRYLRTALVLLLVGLGAAVSWQTHRQGSYLSSVSAYYYTAAQAMFVGALIGLAVCMMVLRGTNAVEDVALNLAGMFAAVVAIVPTGRGEDYNAAVEACRKAGPLLTAKAATKLDCPTVKALEDATRANVENNMLALAVVGALGLVVAMVYTAGERKKRRFTTSEVRKFRWGFGLAAAVYLLGIFPFWLFRTWFIRHGHYLAALGLFVCIVVAVVANAVRRRPRRQDAGRDDQTKQGRQVTKRAVEGVRVVRHSLFHWDWYAAIAWIFLLVAAAGTVLVLVHRISLFWLEVAVGLLFIGFWSVQTVDLWSSDPAGHTPGE